jgi:hypothetical protein
VSPCRTPQRTQACHGCPAPHQPAASMGEQGHPPMAAEVTVVAPHEYSRDGRVRIVAKVGGVLGGVDSVGIWATACVVVALRKKVARPLRQRL